LLVLGSLHWIGEFAERVGRSVSTIRWWESDLLAIVQSFSCRFYGLRRYELVGGAQ